MFIMLFSLKYNSKLLFQQRGKFLIILMVQEFRQTKTKKTKKQKTKQKKTNNKTFSI